MLKILNRIQIKPKVFESQIVVSPCWDEHWISTDLFKFRIWAEREQKHVIGICSHNQIPHFSLFCDELKIVKSNPNWYEGLRTTYSNVINQKTENIEEGPLRKEFTQISDEEVIERFKNREISILKSVYNDFFKLDLPSNVVVVEAKARCDYLSHIKSMNLPYMIGVDHQFQKELLGKLGNKNYMTIQILASNFLNWQFLCCEGSSNLLGVLPVKTLVLSDRTIDRSFINIVRGINKNKEIPYINNHTVPTPGVRDVGFNYKYINDNVISRAFEILSTEWEMPIFNFL